MATLNGTSGNDSLTGTAGDDSLSGLEDDDSLEGGDGDDSLYGGAGEDYLSGGAGDDTYVMKANDWDDISDSGGVDTIVAVDRSGGITDGLENLILRSETGKVWPGGVLDFIKGNGNDLDNVIRNERQHGAPTWINGKGGDDTLIGNSHGEYFVLGGDAYESSGHFLDDDYGHDYVNGRGGFDTLLVGPQSAALVDFRTGTVTGGGKDGAGSATFINIEGAFGQAFNDYFIADDEGRHLNGGKGDDTLVGGAGGDTLSGDGLLTPMSPPNRIVGNDYLQGGGGGDNLAGGYGSDTVKGGTGNDTVSGGGDTDYVLGGSGNDVVVWSEGDLLNGGAGTDRLGVVSQDVDLTAVANDKLIDIEVVDMSYRNNDGFRYGNKLALNKADVLDMSSTTDTLKVLGEQGDSVNIVGSFRDLGVSGKYHHYKLGAATLLVDTDITDVH